jgi:ribosomal protein S27AE
VVGGGAGVAGSVGRDNKRVISREDLMIDFVTLACPSCGGQLQITSDIERFACGYCGNEYTVKRAGGIVTLSPVVKELKKVQVGVYKTASELAIKRLKEEIEDLERTIVEKKRELLRKDKSIMVKLSRTRKIPFLKSVAFLNMDETDNLKELASTSLDDLKGLILECQRVIDINKSGWRSVVFNTQKERSLIDFIEEIIDLENAVAKKQAQLRKHEQIVSQ